jgi:hypothetical protein
MANVEALYVTANYDDGVLGERMFGSGQYGVLLRLNEAGDTWENVASGPSLGASWQGTLGLCVYDNGDGDKLYGLISWKDGSDQDCITLVKWNGTNAWVVIATLAAGTPADHSYYAEDMIVYNVPANGGPALFIGGGHYDGATYNAALYRWDGEDALDIVGESPDCGYSFTLAAMGAGLGSYLYMAGIDGKLIRWNYNSGDLEEISSQIPDLEIYALAVHDGSMFCGGMGFGGDYSSLWRWSGIISEIDEAPFEAGDGYAVDDVLTLSTGSGDATVKVTSIGGGGGTGPVTGLELVSGGTSGYERSEGNATTTGGAGLGCTVTIFALLWEKVADAFEDEEEIDCLIDLDGDLLGSTWPHGLLLRWNETDAWEQVAGQSGSTEWLSQLSVMDGVLYCGANNDSGVGGQLLRWIPPVVGTPEWLPEQPSGGAIEVDISELADHECSAGSVIRKNSVVADSWNPTFGFAALYVNSDGEYEMAENNVEAKMPCSALALEDGNGSGKKVLIKGIIRWDPDICDPWIIGGRVYVGSDQGTFTQEVPGTGGVEAWEQCIGVALDWNILLFDPDWDIKYHAPY